MERKEGYFVEGRYFIRYQPKMGIGDDLIIAGSVCFICDNVK